MLNDSNGRRLLVKVPDRALAEALTRIPGVEPYFARERPVDLATVLTVGAGLAATTMVTVVVKEVAERTVGAVVELLKRSAASPPPLEVTITYTRHGARHVRSIVLETEPDAKTVDRILAAVDAAADTDTTAS